MVNQEEGKPLSVPNNMATKKTTKKTTKKMSNKAKAGIGIGLTAAAVGAAGAYFFYGAKEAKKNRKKAKSWMLKAKAEVLEGLEKASEMTEEQYDELIQGVATTYSKLKDASKADIRDFRKEMLNQWKEIAKVAKPKVKKATTKRTVKKSTVKKSTKKATKKK